MECNEEGCDITRRLEMEWSMRLNLTNKVSTGNAETMSAMAKLKGPPGLRSGGDEAT